MPYLYNPINSDSFPYKKISTPNREPDVIVDGYFQCVGCRINYKIWVQENLLIEQIYSDTLDDDSYNQRPWRAVSTDRYFLEEIHNALRKGMSEFKCEHVYRKKKGLYKEFLHCKKCNTVKDSVCH